MGSVGVCVYVCVCLCVCIAAGEKKQPGSSRLALVQHQFGLACVCACECVYLCARFEGGDIRPVDATKCALCKIRPCILNIFQLFCMSIGHWFHLEPVLK